MSNRYTLTMLFCLLACQSVAAQAVSDFCKSVRTLPLESEDETARLIQAVDIVRAAEGSKGNGQSVEDVNKVVKPYRLSPSLEQVFADAIGGPEYDYSVYRSDDASLFQFTSIQGSLKCAYDIWAVRRGEEIFELAEGPDLGEACSVSRKHGTFEITPILVQHTYQYDEGDISFALGGKLVEVRVVALQPDRFGDVCVIERQ